MPEGPEIRRAADRLAAVLEGERVTRINFGLAHLKTWERRLRSTRIRRVQARGKAILTRFSNGLVIYSHNQLYGRWEIVTGDEYPESTRKLRLAIHAGGHAALLYSASDIEVLNEEALEDHPYLSRLGPELLDGALDTATVAARLAEPRWRRRALMGLLQDQSVLAGMGNYLCCEALHVAGIHPRLRPADLPEDKLTRLADACLRLTRQSYVTGGITNDLDRAERLRQEGLPFEDYRFHVYRRAGLPCYRCGMPILKARFSGRMGYICPGCQPGERPSPL